MDEMKKFSFKSLFSPILCFFRNCRSAIMNWWEGLHLSTGQADCGVNGESSATGESSSSEESAAAESSAYAAEGASPSAGNATKGNGQKFLNVLLSVPDITASLCLCAAVVVALRPQLLSSDFQKLPDSFSAVVDFGNFFFKAYIRPRLPEEVLRYRNFFVVLFLFLYLFGKIWVIAFSAGKTRKALSVLFIAMTLLSCTLVVDKFLVFILFVLLLFMGFQYSIGLSSRFALRKLGVIALLAVSGYIAFVFCADVGTLPAWFDMLDALKRCLSRLALPVQSWL